MAKWIKFHLNLGKTESGHQLISKKLVLDMHRVTTPLPSGPTAISRPNYPVSHLYTGYGYGWGVGEYRGIALCLVIMVTDISRLFCEQQRHRPVCVFAKSDQRLFIHCLEFNYFNFQYTTLQYSSYSLNR